MIIGGFARQHKKMLQISPQFLRKDTENSVVLGLKKVQQNPGETGQCSAASNIGLGDIAKKIITIIFPYQSISIIITINVKSLFLSSLKTYFCSKVKVVETRPLIFLNKINI